MGLINFGKNIANTVSPVDGSAEAAESRRLVKKGRAVLDVKPDWRGGEGDQAALSAALDELQTALANIDGRLVLGLLGGTGVGKSTLISALAGEPVSEASVVRPTTSRPVIYRHEAFPKLVDFSGHEVIHRVEILRGLAIVDFPDFDSLETAHHRLVVERLREIDLVVWVTDHNKYADRRLYEVMRLVNQVLASDSQVVALNKVDELTAYGRGEEALSEVLSSLHRQLVDFGNWAGAAPWPISAADSLAKPGDRSAGGLAPLRDLLDSLADAKVRRAVEMGNLQARNMAFKENLKQAADPETWLRKLEALKQLAGDFHPLRAIEGDLASLTLLRQLYLAPRMDRAKRKASGLLSVFTDAWAFLASRFGRAGQSDLPPAAPPPAAPGLVRYLLGRDEDLAFITGLSTGISGDELARESEAALDKALNENFYMLKDPRPASWLLFFWPVFLAIILVWAESGGQFGGPAAVTAAALRSMAPWFIFGLIGDAVLTGFIWYRVRRRLENYFQKAMDQARDDLLKLAEGKISLVIEEGIEHHAASLDRLADLQAEMDN